MIKLTDPTYTGKVVEFLLTHDLDKLVLFLNDPNEFKSAVIFATVFPASFLEIKVSQN